MNLLIRNGPRIKNWADDPVRYHGIGLKFRGRVVGVGLATGGDCFRTWKLVTVHRTDNPGGTLWLWRLAFTAYRDLQASS